MAATEQIRRPGRTLRAPALAVDDTIPNDATEGALSGDTANVRVSRLEWALYSAFIVVGAVMRVWQLGSRAMHHDESLHATYSWYLWERITGASPAAQYTV